MKNFLRLLRTLLPSRCVWSVLHTASVLGGYYGIGLKFDFLNFGGLCWVVTGALAVPRTTLQDTIRPEPHDRHHGSQVQHRPLPIYKVLPAS